MSIRFSLLAETFIIFLGAAVLLTLIGMGVNLSVPYLGGVKLILALTYVLFVPGYLLQAAVFPVMGYFDWLERAALSLGLSIALILPMVLIIEVIPGAGLFLRYILAAEGMSLFSLHMIAFLHRARIPRHQRFVITVRIHPVAWWQQQDFLTRFLVSLLIIAVAVGIGSSAMILIAPAPADFYSDFYLLNNKNQAESFPHNVIIGRPNTVRVGVTNHEDRPVAYRVELHSLDTILLTRTIPELAPGETFEGPITFAAQQPGENIAYDFYLFLATSSEDKPYRSLRLWLNVEKPS